LVSLNGISLVDHLKNKNKKALKVSERALRFTNKETSVRLKNQTVERYVQALIWNKKYPIAAKEIDKLLNDNKNPENWMLSLRATLFMYKSDFKKSLKDYDLILKNDPTSFDGHLGKANALKATGYYTEAYKSAENTLQYHENQKDAINFIQQLDARFTPFVDAKTSYSYDNGNNIAKVYNINFEIPFSTKFKVLSNFNNRATSNKISALKATSNNFLAGISYQLSNNLTLKSSFGITTSTSEENKYSKLLTDISISMKPFKLQKLELGYKRDIQNFNAALLNEEIVQNNFILNYNVNTNFNVGWFTQYYYTAQSDKNIRNLLFTSLYYRILEKPTLKAGINYQNISFKNQVPTIYFSPRQFVAVEAFIHIMKDEMAAKRKEWFYEATAATGLQYIEGGAQQSTYRIQAKVGYKFSQQALLNFFGTQSNIASAVASANTNGFVFTEFGIRFKWHFQQKPLFKRGR
jgi:hypothetical protein